MLYNCQKEMKHRWLPIAKLIKENNFRHYCEIGVSRGDNARAVIKVLQLENYRLNKVYLIDISEEEKIKLYGTELAKKFQFDTKELKRHFITYINNGSQEASTTIPDNEIELIFWDANVLEPKYLEEDLNLWIPKLKINGIFCGRFANPNPTKENWTPQYFIKEIIEKKLKNINYIQLQESNSGKDNYFWWYQK